MESNRSAMGSVYFKVLGVEAEKPVVLKVFEVFGVEPFRALMLVQMWESLVWQIYDSFLLSVHFIVYFLLGE